MEQISFVIPSRENLKYLKWAYDSIRKNSDPTHWICFADDASTDGTWDWIQEKMKVDKYIKAIKNEGPDRLGHTILYDRIVEELVETDIFIIYHADMFLAPGAIEKILETIKPKSVVSLTRIEPPLHPIGSEKLVYDCGTEPEDFDEDLFLTYIDIKKEEHKNKTTEGIFAPWAIYKDDFLKIGGHDPLYAPQSREDSDIFNRFILVGYKSIQIRDAFAYHMTCRGSRYNPKLTFIGQESEEWLAHNKKSERNFIRKWGHMVKVDNHLKPVIPHKYNMTFIVNNCTTQILDALEPWCTRIYCESTHDIINMYIEHEQPNTMYDLNKRVFLLYQVQEYNGDIIIKFDGSKLTQQNFEVITQLPFILEQINECGEYKYDIFSIRTQHWPIRHYEDELIFCDKTQKIR